MEAAGAHERLDPVAGLDLVGVRGGAARDRHSRGHRGPLALPGPLTHRTPTVRPPRDEFDELVLTLVRRYERRLGDELGEVEFGTEDVPELPPDWGDDPVPFGSLTPPAPGRPARIVVFRRPVEMRAPTEVERVALVREILVEHLAELLGRDPDEIDR